MMRTTPHTPSTKQCAALLAAVLGLALFLSPVQLHLNSANFPAPAAQDHASHAQHGEAPSEDGTLNCLRCVLYGFQLPETAAPLIVIFVVLGFLKVARPAEPFSFIAPSKSARAPPVSV
jgi:hypothetical protein